MPAHCSYKISDAAKAAGVPVKTVSRDIDRKVIKIPGPAPGKGNRHLLAPPAVYGIAIGYALTKVFVPPTVAMEFAKLFFEPQRCRKAGELFKTGKTWLLVSNGVGSIINQQIDEDIAMFFPDATTTAVDLGSIISTVNERLIN